MAEGRRAVSTFATTVDGEEHLVHAGEVLPATHPVAKARPELFGAEEPGTAKKRMKKKT